MLKVGCCFLLQGPFVQVDELIETFRRCTLPESKLLLSAHEMLPTESIFSHTNMALVMEVSVRASVK